MIYVRDLSIVTDAGGAAALDVRVRGVLVAVEVEVGTLSTPDFTLSDQPANVTLLALVNIAVNGRYYPSVAMSTLSGGVQTGAFTAPAVMSRIHIDVAGAGAVKTGVLRLFLVR